MKRILNFIIETFYPDRFFYGKKANPFDIYRDGVLDDQKTPEMIAAMFLANYMADNEATNGKFEISGVEKSGEKRGDWLIEITKIEEKE